MDTLAFLRRSNDRLFIREGFLGLSKWVFFANNKRGLCTKYQHAQCKKGKLVITYSRN